MPDLMDRAQSAAAINDEDALASHRAICAARESRLPPGRPDRANNECAICTGKIQPARLRALPTTKFCAACAREFENMMQRESRWM